jgi:hypothetical protein
MTTASGIDADLFRELALAAARYYTALEDVADLAAGPTVQREARLAQAARRCLELAKTAATLEGTMPRHRKRLLTELGGIIRGQAVRWRWEAYLDEGGEGLIARRLERHERKYQHPRLAALIAWRMMPEAPRSRALDNLADEAERLSIVPAKPLALDAAEARYRRLDAAWRAAPALAGEAPAPTPGELLEVARLATALEAEYRRFEESTPAPQPEHRIEPSTPKQRKRRGGRPRDTDIERDRRIAIAWASRKYRRYIDLEVEMKLKPGEVERAIDRHRKLQKRDG